MHLSTRARYAVMAMVDLACRDGGEAPDGGPVTLAQIAASQQLSLCYLEQLFVGLRRAGLVLSARGPGGGYRLGRPAVEMVIADIVDAVEEPIRATRCADEAGCMKDKDGGTATCSTHDLWCELERQIRLFLSGVTLADVVHGRVSGRAVAPLLLEAV
ncbi:DNA-binding transcriptional dual regulator IscR [Rhodovastum atsumiense]|uniref:Rrf2 family transcriptional regulator n=1 Tax=Rhodovastum atsumiense TaxID=504468 RepID=A0A5M6IRL0_9PROT|nr:Rrf2 family transcriptional regulator [Rhodovastum atsumiense]KAA5610933.1 Rrf2 family transcriptional regulator [Rhodovastum atsumiense]CAH2601495.1 DNA-binding transcriptional dual regulator IscR [Rhodovastum atsumiense]